MKIKHTFIFCVSIISLFFNFISIPACADSISREHILTDMYDGSTVNAGHDTGFSKRNEIKKNDLHFGWSLGSFTIDGYTEVTEENSIPVFLVNPDDSIILSFRLSQNIDKLNGDESLAISYDKNGFDSAFQVEQTEFGRGALLVKYTDHNNTSRVTPHFDYLTAVKNHASRAIISNLEEGDYEVALDYEIAHKILFSNFYDDYRTTFKFKIRNSNCMIYLRDTKSKNELSNYTVAENGFYLDYTSFYQSIIVKREILTKTENGYTLTPRACKSAKNLAQYTDPGVYTVTVKNKYTNESVQMFIAVGNDPLTNAYVVSNCVYKPEQISEMLDHGDAVLTSDWRIKVVEKPTPTIPPSTEQTVLETSPNPNNSQNATLSLPSTSMTALIQNNGLLITVSSVAAVALIGFIITLRKNKKLQQIKNANEQALQTLTEEDNNTSSGSTSPEGNEENTHE